MSTERGSERGSARPASKESAAAMQALATGLARADIASDIEADPSQLHSASRATQIGETLLLADGSALAGRVAVAARARALGLRAALVVAPSDVEATVGVLSAQTSLCSDVLVALHTSPTLATLRAIARQLPGATVLAVGDARRVTDGRAASEEFDTLGVARALGLAACDVPAVAVDARTLALVGLRPRGTRDVDALCADRDIARLMRDAIARGGLNLAGKGGVRVGGVRVEPRDELRDAAAAALMVGELARVGREDLLVVVAPELGLDDGPEHVNLGSVPAEPLRAAAIAAAITPRAQRRMRRRTSDRAATERATRLLDGWRAQLSELQLKELLACYGVEAPAETVARSASAAGAAAAELGLPVLLRPVGLAVPDEERDSSVLAVTASAARQVFRNVVSRSEHGIAGVLVTRQQQRALGFSCTMLFDDDDALLQLCARAAPRATEQPIWAAPIALPDRDGETSAANALVRTLALPRATNGVVRSFVRAMADFAADHGPRLSWIAIGRVDVFVDDEGQARLEVVRGRGEQRISLRDPFR